MWGASGPIFFFSMPVHLPIKRMEFSFCISLLPMQLWRLSHMSLALAVRSRYGKLQSLLHV